MIVENTINEFEQYVYQRHKWQGYVTILQDFKNHIFPYIKDIKITNLNNKEIIKWQNTILKKKFSNKYNQKVRYAFSVYFNYLIDNSYLENNIITEVGAFPKKIEVKKHTTYNIFQFLWFKFHLKSYITKSYFHFMYSYGPRPSETMALRFVDNKGKYLRIIHSLHRKGNRELDTPKNQSSIRCFKISLLWRYRFWKLKKFYLKKYGSFSNDYYIFGGPKPLAPTSVDREKKDAYTKARLHPITQYEFRHTFCTRKIHHRVPIDKVSRLMGHSKVSTTLDNYLHLKEKKHI